MIEVNNLEKTWRRGRTRVGLLPVSFTVPDGQIVGVLGDNGAGKTTLLRTMAGLCRPKPARRCLTANRLPDSMTVSVTSLGKAVTIPV